MADEAAEFMFRGSEYPSIVRWVSGDMIRMAPPQSDIELGDIIEVEGKSFAVLGIRHVLQPSDSHQILRLALRLG